MYTIDRFEGEYALLEDENKKMHKVHREEIPKQAKEGDCLQKLPDGYAIDEEATVRRKERIRNLMKSLFE